MRSVFYYLIIAFILLLFEATLFRSVFENFFIFLGLDSISHICVNTSFVICLYIAQTRKLNATVFSAFVLGYFKDILLLSNSWINPFLFVICAVISNILRNFFLIKGTFLFMIHVFVMSVLYFILWAIVANNIWSELNTLMIALVAFFPASFLNSVFSPFIFIPLRKYDLHFEKETTMGFSITAGK